MMTPLEPGVKKYGCTMMRDAQLKVKLTRCDLKRDQKRDAEQKKQTRGRR